MNSVKDITIETIIERRLIFIEKRDFEEENKYYYQGLQKAYKKIINDLKRYDEKRFLKKYIKILKKLNKKFDNNNLTVETEILSGYNNGIVEILELLNPILRYQSFDD